MKTKPKVLFTNNYSMDYAYNLCRKGVWGLHHLWGAGHLDRYGIEVEILKFPKNKIRLEDKIPRYGKLFGDIRQQVRIFNKNDYDLIYTGAQNVANSLAYLRAIKLFRKPIITLAYNPFPMDCRSDKLVMLGYTKGMDKIICLSKPIQKSILNFYGVLPEKICFIEWGADTDFYPYSENHEDFIISAGQSGRDYDTFCKSAMSINTPVEIYCSNNALPKPPLPKNIKVSFSPNENYNQLMARFIKSRFVVIPMQAWDQVLGLMSLFEAMALGKAVIMTKNSHITVDIEKHGCGIWVEPYDVKGWVNAMKRLIENPSEALEMGRNGRRLCEEYYNIKRVSRDIAEIMFEVV